MDMDMEKEMEMEMEMIEMEVALLPSQHDKSGETMAGAACWQESKFGSKGERHMPQSSKRNPESKTKSHPRRGHEFHSVEFLKRQLPHRSTACSPKGTPLQSTQTSQPGLNGVVESTSPVTQCRQGTGGGEGREGREGGAFQGADKSHTCQQGQVMDTTPVDCSSRS